MCPGVGTAVDMAPKKKKNKKKKGKGGGNSGVAVDIRDEDGKPIEELTSQVEGMALTSTAAAPPVPPVAKEVNKLEVDIQYTKYTHEAQMTELVAMIEKDLSEPYSIFTYRWVRSSEWNARMRFHV